MRHEAVREDVIPAIEWLDMPDVDRETLVDRLNRARRVGADGRVRYERDPDVGGDPYIEDAEGVLASAFKFPDDVRESDARGAVWRALRSPHPRDLDADALLGAVDAEVSSFRERAPESHVLVGALSVRYFEDLPTTELAGCRITFHPSVPERFLRGHAGAMQKARWHVPGRVRPGTSTVPGYANYTVEAEGRSGAEAFGRARTAIAALRGIWNLALLKAEGHPPGGSPSLNHVQPGPVESLQPPEGSPLPYPIRYNTDFAEPVNLLQSGRLQKHWEYARYYEDEVRAGLATSRHPTEVAGFLRDYAVILDARDTESAFLGLWGLLERLTGVSTSDKHPAAVNRAAYLLPEDLRAPHRLTLDSLRRHRNTGVHEGVLPGDARDLLRQLRRYVIVVLELHLNPRFDVSGSEEARAYLTQLPERDGMLQRISSLKREGRDEEARLAALGMDHHYRPRPDDSP